MTRLETATTAAARHGASTGFGRRSGILILAAMVLFLCLTRAGAEQEYTCYGKLSSDPTVCSGKGSCTGNDQCECNTGYAGEQCQTQLYNCYGTWSNDPAVCSGNGTCTATDTCNCSFNHIGTQCETQLYTCYGTLSSDPTVCSGHGTCTATDTCNCSSNYIGTQCETQLYSCYGTWSNDPTVCNGHGSCTGLDQCSCSNGWLGQQCTVDCYNIIVTSSADSGAGSLPQAIADSCSGGTITFAGNYTIALASGLTIDRNLTIDGAGHSVTVDGQLAVTVFTVNSGISFNANALTVAHGVNGFGGGGIFNYHGSITVTNSTFTANNAGYRGGGLYSEFGNTLVRNTTFSGNSAVSLGGGLSTHGGSLTINNSTFSGNSAENGGGLHDAFGSVNVTNSLFAGSTGGNCCNISSSGSNNLADDGSCGSGFTYSSSILLGTLGSYGGPTQTVPLLPGSAAIDAGDNATCASTDQRGLARPQGAGCDIGAFEFMEDNEAPDTSISAHPANPSTSASASFSFAGDDGYGSGVAGFECQLDGGGFAACASPKSYASLTNVSHTFQVRAVDNIGHVDGTPAEYVWVVDVPVTTTTTTTALAVSTTTTSIGPTTTTTTAASSTTTTTEQTTTTTVPACSVRIIPKNIGWLIGETEKIRFLLVIGEREAAYDENTKVSWDSDAIEIRNKRVFLKRFMLMQVHIDGSQLDKGDYTLSVGGCTGTVHMVR